MKKKAIIFVGMALFILMVVPVINFKLGTIKEGYKPWSGTVLFSFDFALPYLGHIFYPLGISIDPSQAIIGINDWLYLGDTYAKTLSIGRYGASAEEEEAAKKLDASQNLGRNGYIVEV